MIVHLGLGAFHRAHQAVYTQDAGDWRSAASPGGAARSSTPCARNDWRYTVDLARARATTRSATIDVIREALVAADEPDAVVERIAAPDRTSSR